MLIIMILLLLLIAIVLLIKTNIDMKCSAIKRLRVDLVRIINIKVVIIEEISLISKEYIFVDKKLYEFFVCLIEKVCAQATPIGKCEVFDSCACELEDALVKMQKFTKKDNKRLRNLLNDYNQNEEKLEFNKEFYNRAIREHNRYIQKFPNALVAFIFNNNVINK